MTNTDWLINLQNTADTVADALGWDIVRFILQNHGASSIENLSPSCYSDVFSELYFYEADLKD